MKKYHGKKEYYFLFLKTQSHFDFHPSFSKMFLRPFPYGPLLLCQLFSACTSMVGINIISQYPVLFYLKLHFSNALKLRAAMTFLSK